jgi:plasmid stabilization system protein ParE
LNLNFTPQARADLFAIRAWIAETDERAAERVISRIRQTVMMFGQFPLLGRRGRVEELASSPSWAFPMSSSTGSDRRRTSTS